MHDIKSIRENPEAFDAGLERRGLEPQSAHLLELDAKRRAVATKLQEAQGRRNEASKAIGQAMGQGDKDKAEALKAEVAELKQSMVSLNHDDLALGKELEDALAIIPNLPADDVPQGANEADNVEVTVWGEKPIFDFTPQEHADFAPALGMDFETGTKLSGARFTFLRGNMARLHRALGQFMLDQQTRENGYTECAPPVLVNDDAMYGTDKLPKFAEDSFQTSIGYENWRSGQAFNTAFSDQSGLTEAISQSKDEGATLRAYVDGVAKRLTKQLGLQNASGSYSEQPMFLEHDPQRRRWLIPTAEVSLTASVMGEIVDDAKLPMRMTALTQCFRSEAGSAGKDTRGFIRQHQFEKCELVSVVRPEDSEAEHERMTAAAEGVLQALGLAYRKVLLCTGDMGFGARKTYDLEVWLPGQDAYREISSCSNTGDFQARRMKTRFKREGEKKTEFVHTLNGSGLAVGRTLVAVIENYQNADGSVTVPEALAPYMGGVTKIEAQ